MRDKGKLMGSKMKDTTIQSVKKVKDIQIGKKQVAPALEKQDRVKAAHHDTDDEESDNRFEEEHSFHELSEHDSDHDLAIDRALEHGLDQNGADSGLPAGATSPISVQSASSMSPESDVDGPFSIGPMEAIGSGSDSEDHGDHGMNGQRTTPNVTVLVDNDSGRYKKRVTVTSLNVRRELVELPDTLPFSHIVYGENYVPTNMERNVEEMKAMDLRDEAMRIIRALFEKYIEVGSEMELNLSFKLRKKSLAKLAKLDTLEVHQMEQL